MAQAGSRRVMSCTANTGSSRFSLEQDLEAVSYRTLADMQISLWVSNNFSNPGFSWFRVTCRNSILLTWINKLVEASWSEEQIPLCPEQPKPGTCASRRLWFWHTQNSEMMFGILEGSDFLVTIKKQGSQQRTVKLHKNM